MLYERWRQIAQEHRSEMALREIRSGQQWTFEQLMAQSDRAERSDVPMVVAEGMTPEFVFAVLRAWRADRVSVPLELGQKPISVAELPSGIVHLKTTSATTGEPRAVAFTASQLMADTENIV